MWYWMFWITKKLQAKISESPEDSSCCDTEVSSTRSADFADERLVWSECEEMEIVIWEFDKSLFLNKTVFYISYKIYKNKKLQGFF